MPNNLYLSLFSSTSNKAAITGSEAWKKISHQDITELMMDLIAIN
jgi:hypothetical protein